MFGELPFSQEPQCTHAEGQDGRDMSFCAEEGGSMKDCAIAAERCGHVYFGREITGCAGRIYGERELFVDLCCDCRLENEGDIFVVRMDVPG